MIKSIFKIHQSTIRENPATWNHLPSIKSFNLSVHLFLLILSFFFFSLSNKWQKKKEEEKSNEYRSTETPYHLYPGHRIVSNQLANHAVNTNRYHEPGGGDLSSCVTPGRERIRQGLVCNNVGTKSTSIKTNVNSHGGTTRSVAVT